ncbi:hypothetical protein Glove_230g121 [Diversispora epigaea]|uniref:Uncharacterized protein n=1 Tax=Diversispora epigaea TaxID=1348612 RepID=A0A397ICJ2_9GLOM|nr:hypothetical protein Glove_230g121 [Diversispora epigaea]
MIWNDLKQHRAFQINHYPSTKIGFKARITSKNRSCPRFGLAEFMMRSDLSDFSQDKLNGVMVPIVMKNRSEQLTF